MCVRAKASASSLALRGTGSEVLGGDVVDVDVDVDADAVVVLATGRAGGGGWEVAQWAPPWGRGDAVRASAAARWASRRTVLTLTWTPQAARDRQIAARV